MNTIRRLLGKASKPPNLETHEQILHDMQAVTNDMKELTEQFRQGDPLTRMVRGNWRGERGPAGPSGAQGVQGIQGVQGEQGIQGIEGERGQRIRATGREDRRAQERNDHEDADSDR
jgi:hypothetical protein